MKILWHSFKIAFSMYSKIPMPYSDWKKENMRYAMGFFPLIGIVTGIGVYLLSFLFERVSIVQGSLFRAAALTVLPILITGGIHMDGFLDVSDAMSSYQERERRLEILKDSHAGAFAIICGLCYLILYFGSVSVITTEMFPVVGIGFVLVRANSGLSIVTFKMAKNTGLAASFSDAAQKRVIRIWMHVYQIICVALMLWYDWIPGICCAGAAFLVFFYYRRLAYKNFGGINGDLAGWYVQMSELWMMLAAAILTIVR